MVKVNWVDSAVPSLPHILTTYLPGGVEGEELIFKVKVQVDRQYEPEGRLKEQELPEGSPLRQVVRTDNGLDAFEN